MLGIHQLTFAEAAKLSIHEMRHLWLFNAQKISNPLLLEIPGLENFLDLKTKRRSLILRQLTRRIETIAPNIEAQITALSVSQLESVGEALLDFSSAADLDEWLQSHS